ncbi:MAG: Hpt domain-containing protein [Candidatus Aminicenantes bacterium]|nr:Hpt domain-containing protein [Candidatus Aminicenantes bacterium]
MVNLPGKTTDEIFMEDLKQEFMDSVATRLKDMRRLLDENNYAEIARIAHDIKGTAGVFGLDEGTELARELQYAAQDGKAAETGTLIAKLTEYMKKNGVDI